jgi:hypothetical protein
MNVADERKLLLRGRVRDWRNEGIITPESAQAIDADTITPWRTHSVLLQAVFFVLTAVGTAAFYLFADLIAHQPGIFVGIVCLAVAEGLIALKWARTGVESALWIGGLVSMITVLPHTGAPEAMLVCGAVCAAAGLRVRNPLFGAAAAVFLMHYFERRFDLGVVFALGAAFIALVALTRTWRRPSNEWLFIAIAAILPVAGWFEAGVEWRPTTIALYTFYAAIAFVGAILKRHHAMYLSAAISLAIACTELSRLYSFAVEVTLAVAGTLLLSGAWIVSRMLRDRRVGVVATSDVTAAEGGLQIIGALVASQIATQSSVSTDRGFEGGGGNFGGGGASGSY